MRKRPPTEVTERVARALRLLVIRVVVFNHQAAATLGLSSTENEFLHLLGLNGPQSPGQLARATGLTSGSVTGVLDRLEQAGFVRRDHDPVDRRKIIITAEPDRLADVGTMFKAHKDVLAQVVSDYEADQLEVIADFLTRLADTAEQGVKPADRPGRRSGRRRPALT